MLNPVPMTFKLKSFEIVLDFKDGEDKMTLKLSEQKGDSADSGEYFDSDNSGDFDKFGDL